MIRREGFMEAGIFLLLIISFFSKVHCQADCRDTADWCERNKILCGNHAEVDARCKLTCGTCPGVIDTINCRDTEDWCRDFPHLCGTNAQVDRHCKKTCNKCGGGGPVQCVDSDPTCSLFASMCATNTGIQASCRKTCNTCDAGGNEGQSDYSKWTDYGSCSDQCGGGIHSRTRTCLISSCSGHLEEIKNCNEQDCPDANCQDVGRNCRLKQAWGLCSTPATQNECRKTCDACTGEPGPTWSAYGSCSVTCGVGLKTRTKAGVSQSITCFQPECTGEEEPYWLDWSDYGQCDATCGGGLQERTRKCSVDGQCEGDSKETRDCETQNCPTPVIEECKDTSDWCTPRNRRFCRLDFNFQNGCKKLCGICKGDAVWLDWTDWSQCSAECGPGTQTRTRECSEPGQCGSDSSETQNCNIKDCEPQGDCKDSSSQSYCAQYKVWCDRDQRFTDSCKKTCNKCPDVPSGYGDWSDWTDCPVSCGGGTQERTKVCQVQSCTGPAKETRPCGQSNCPDWLDWTAWSQCSAECGPGIQTRTRECSVPGQCGSDSSETQNCKIKDCGIPGDCEDTSSEAYCLRYRVWCDRNQAFTDGCKKTCNKCPDIPSGYGDWSEWTDCTVSCGGGTQERTRVCQAISCTGPAQESRVCGQADCPEWLDWTDWSQCSADCGPGTQTRTRECSVQGQCGSDSSETRNCKIKDCVVPEWSDWDDWSECSKVCGGGEEERSRTCSVPNKCPGQSKQTRPCNTNRCPVWSDWSGWSRCSKECGPGTLTRTRECSLPGQCGSDSSETQNCKIKDCAVPEWSDWDDWGECNKECGGGEQERSRTCSVPNNCLGESKQTQQCNTNRCPGDCKDISGESYCRQWKAWCGRNAQLTENCEKTCDNCYDGYGDWTDWSDCPVTCDGAEQERTRECQLSEIPCVGPDKETRRCGEDPCPKWSDWTDWSQCTKECDRGERTRSRTCSIPGKCTGSSTETEDCNTARCPDWKTWSDWTKCDKTCGKGEQTRSRECPTPGLCTGDSKETRECEINPCPEWDDWTPWDKCSKICGPGTQARSRSCKNGGGCEGRSTESRPCNDKPCDQSQWTQCSKSCGGGTRKRLVNNKWEFEDCGNGDCPIQICSLGNQLFDNRYKSRSECCAKEHLPKGSFCGRPNDGSRIIGGQDAPDKQWPWSVAFQARSGGFCGGVLIDNTWVLTAAHCLAFDDGRLRDPAGTFSSWNLHIGILKLTASNPQTQYQFKKVYVHPDYNFPRNDIALIEIARPATFSDFVHPLCLPFGEETPLDSNCYVTGWGVSTVPDTTTSHLQEVEIKNYDPLLCAHYFKSDPSVQHHVGFMETSKKVLCAGSVTKKVDSCQGDSGGPLVCQRCNSCDWYLAGIVSFGPLPCGNKVPAVYTKVKEYEDWIFGKTGMDRYTMSCSL